MRGAPVSPIVSVGSQGGSPPAPRSARPGPGSWRAAPAARAGGRPPSAPISRLIQIAREIDRRRDRSATWAPAPSGSLSSARSALAVTPRSGTLPGNAPTFVADLTDYAELLEEPAFAALPS